MTRAEIVALRRAQEQRRAAACRSFWSDDPLNLTYRQQIGRESFSLKAFVAFVLDLPQDQFEACTRVRS